MSDFSEYSEILEVKQRNPRRWQVRPHNEDWYKNGYYRKTFLPTKERDPELFFQHTRMTSSVYDTLYKLVSKPMRKAHQRIGVDERLSITLLCLAQGCTFRTAAIHYKLGKTTVRNIVFETSELLWEILAPIYVTEPNEAQYNSISEDFQNIWDMRGCVGAIDYRKFYNIVMMATSDARYIFTSINIANLSNEIDEPIFHQTKFGEELADNTLLLPPYFQLSETSNQMFPHYFIGDETFPLLQSLMKPYPVNNLSRTKKVFNYRLSRARTSIDNAFGILTARWPILQNEIDCKPENSAKILLACIALHNFAMLHDQERLYCPEKYADWIGDDDYLYEGQWRDEVDEDFCSFTNIAEAPSSGTSATFSLRDILANYLENEGAVPYQNRMVDY